MIPQVTMSWASRQTSCRYSNCNEPIEAGTPEVVAFFSSKKEDGKSWTVKHHYHPQCWIQNGLDYLKANPYAPEQEKPKLTPEQKEQRDAILRKYASLRQQQRKLKLDNPRYDILFANIEAKIAGLMLDILPLGGIPRKWANG